MTGTTPPLSLLLALTVFQAPHLLADVTVTEPTGGNGISADKALNSTNGAGFTALGPIVIAEGDSADFAPGTNQSLILTLPPGFQFQTVGAPTTASFSASGDITKATVAVTLSDVTVTFTVQGTSHLDTLSITNLRVQAFDGSDPNALYGGYMLNLSANPGTATIAGIWQDATTFGLLYLSPGAPKSLQILTEPPATANAGVVFNPQPDVDTFDQFGNQCYQDVSTVISASRGAGSAALQGTVTQSVIAGDLSYGDLSFNVANTITIVFTAPGLGSVTSTPVVVRPGTANRLAFTTQPASAASGFPFSIQPSVSSQDQFGNASTIGLAAHQTVTMSLSSGIGPLLGNTTQDIGTSAGNGVATYTNLEVDATGNKQLIASSTGFTNAISSVFSVSGAAFSQLLLLAPGEAFAPGTATGKTGTPATQTAGTAFSVTVNAVDASFNLVTNISDTVKITSTDANAVVPANTPLVNGTKTFSVTLKTGGSVSVTASDAADNTKTASTSSAITLKAGAFAKLQLLVPGEMAMPGTAFGKTGSPTSQIAGGSFNVTVNAVDANWNVVNTNDVVAITSSDANAALPANASLGLGSKVLSLTLKTAGSATITAADNTHPTISGSTGPSIAVGAGALARLQILASGETAASGTATGRNGTPTAHTAGSAFNVTVSAVDANWNLVTNVSDTVGIVSSDSNAVLPASLPLLNGTQSFSTTLMTAGTATLTVSDISNPLIQPATSSVITVTAGGFAKLQILVPGESAAPGTSIGKVGTPTTQVAGTAFNLTVNAVDANWNVVNTNDAVAISSTDPNAALASSAALVSGSKIFGATLKTAGAATVTASDNTHPSIQQSTSSSIPVAAGAFARLQILAPGESTAPGSASGKTGTAGAQTAGVAFVLTVNAVDTNWNLVASATDTVSLSSSDVNASLPVNAALAGGTQSFNLTLNSAGTRTVTTSDVTNPSIQQSTTSSLTVGAGAFVKLQLLVPGETAAAGTASGKTGTPIVQTAGTSFSVTVNAVDANWNAVNSGTDTIGLSASDSNASLPTNGVLNLGTKVLSLTLKTAGSATLTASDVANSSIQQSVSASLAVSAGALAKLQILAPGETAAPGTTAGKTGMPAAQTAGIPLKVTVNAVDANWNFVATNDMVSITSSDSNATLPANAALASGSGSFSLMLKSVGSSTVTASDVSHTNIPNSTTPSLQVLAGAFAKLQLLAPGETAAPGTISGKTGTPLTQNASAPFNVTVNAVDAYWNLVNTVSDSVGLSSSDATATLPVATALAGGTNTLTVYFNTNGNFTLTASDLSDGTKTAGISSAIAVSPSQFIPATGGGAISADSFATATFTSLTGPVYAEKASSNISTGTIILKAPSGFIFDTGGTAPTVKITGGTSKTSINRVASGTAVAMTSVTSTQLTFTVTSTSISGATNTLTWQNVRVRPTAGTVLARGNLKASGTAGMVGVSTNSNFGSLREVAGAANNLAIQTQPSASAIAGVPFAQQPVLQVRDQFGNLRSSANGVSDSTLVTAARGAGSGSLQGTLSSTATNGIATFSNLSHNVATNINLLFSASGLTNATSSMVAIRPAAPSALTFATQPANATAGTAFGTQPVLQTLDQFGNKSAAGLPASLIITISLSSGTGPLQGVTNLDIGTGAGNGTGAMTSLRIDAAGTNKQLTATASGLISALSSIFPVKPAATASMVVNAQPPVNATAGAAFSPAPVIQLLDAFGNPAATDSSTVISATRNMGTGTLQGTASVTALNGLATFANLSYNVAEIINLNFSSPGLATLTSANVTVSAGAASRLTILTQPSTSATAGLPFAQQPVIRVEDAFGNLRTSDNSTLVGAARNAGSGTLQGSLSAPAVNGLASFANLSHNVANTINLTFSSSGLTNVTSANIVVGSATFNRLQLLVPGQSAAPGTTNGATGTASAQIANTAFPVTVNAVDAYWNLVNTVSDTVGLSSSDATATLPAATAMAGGTTNLTVYFNTNGNFTLTASDLSDGTKTPSISPAIAVSPSQFIPAAGGGAISADSAATATFTSLTGPVYAEKASSNISTGTIILKAPSGFIFDTGGTAPTVKITGGTSKTSINRVASGTAVAMTSVTSTQLTFTVTSTSISGATNSLTWQNVRVRPTAGTALARGNLKASGTAVMVGVSTNSNFGSLREVAGAANNLAIQTQPSASAIVGVPFAQQPVLQVRDQFANLRSSVNGVSDSTLVTAACGAGSGSLQGTLSIAATNGIATFGNLSYSAATNITISFSSSGLTGATSSVIAVSPAAGPLAMIQPGDVIPGYGVGTQPVSSASAAVNGTLLQLGIQSVANGIRIAVTGSPQSAYQVQRAVSLQTIPVLWENLATVSTDGAGQGQFTDTNPTPGQGYYRAMSR